MMISVISLKILSREIGRARQGNANSYDISSSTTTNNNDSNSDGYDINSTSSYNIINTHKHHSCG